jgi:hypothetical protein
MHIAFDAPDTASIPALYRNEAEFFIRLFDAGLIPNPISWESPKFLDGAK